MILFGVNPMFSKAYSFDPFKTISITVSKAFADNLSRNFQQHYSAKHQLYQKFSKLLVAYFPLLHNDEHHIESVGMFHLFPFPVLQQYFLFFYISGSNGNLRS
jgi:hypothetical protein